MSVADRTPIVRVQTLLGDNAVAAMTGLAALLRERSGLDVRFTDGDGARSSHDAAVWEHDLVWACGLVTARALGSGAFDGDVIAAPVFAGERSPVYRSTIVTRPDADVHALADLARCRVAVNEPASWSGCQGPLAQLRADHGRHAFGDVVPTGTHRRSVEAVADGRADAAAIDGTVWEYLQWTVPASCTGVIEVDRTEDWPAPPFAVHHRLGARVRTRLVEALLSLVPGEVPGLDGVVAADAAPYVDMRDTACGGEGPTTR